MKRGFAQWCGASLLLCWVVAAASCAEPVTETKPYREGESPRSLWIAHDGWHAAIIIRKADIPTAALPELRDFPEAEFLEISWGDADYFPAQEAGVSLTLKAAFWSSGSVIHISGFAAAIEKTYPSAEIIEIALSEDGLGRLIKFISDDMSRVSPATPAKASPGLSPQSRFYPAKSKFSALRTCNTWIAEALRAAGLPLRARYVITAGSLAKQVKPYGAARSGK